MRRKTISTAAVLAFVCSLVFLCTHQAHASFQVMDGKLEISGFLKETVYVRTSWDDQWNDKKYHDSRVDFANTSFYFETLYKLKESPELTVNWFNGLKYWYEATTSLDDDLHRAIPHNEIRNYQRPRRFEDILTESYLDVIKGPLDLRVGKQIVIWGQLDMSKVADVVNPLDLRMGVPGVDSWEEIKKGLWMIRALYQTQLPGNLILEGIINPGFYQHQYLPYEGTHWGCPKEYKSNIFNTNIRGSQQGMFDWLQAKWYRDAPAEWSTDNWELGLRVQGYTFDIDWSVLYWNAKSDNPVSIPSRASAFAFQYVKAGLKSLINNNAVDPGDWDGGKIVRYKRYQTFGGTAQTFFPKLHNSVWRLEWYYELDSPFNRGTDSSSSGAYDMVRKDALGVAVQYNDKWDIPWWTQKIGTGRQFDISITYFIDHIFGENRDLVIDNRNHRKNEADMDAFTMFMKQEMFNTTWVFTFNGNYYLRRQSWMAVPCLTYMFPGEHWRADMGLKIYGGGKNDYSRGYYAHKDSVILRLRYEY